MSTRSSSSNGGGRSLRSDSSSNNGGSGISATPGGAAKRKQKAPLVKPDKDTLAEAAAVSGYLNQLRFIRDYLLIAFLF